MKNMHNLQFTGFEKIDGKEVEVWGCTQCSHTFIAETPAKAKRDARKLPCHDHKEIL